MVLWDWSIGSLQVVAAAPQKKAGVAEHPKVLGHTGLLFDRPPGMAGLSFV
jgi:hypothetical protein